MENLTYTETRKQQYLVAPPLKRKAPQNTFRSYIDQLPDGYGGSILVRNLPRSNRDIYFVVRTSTTQVRSDRRNKTHRNAGLFRTKAGGSTKANLEFMTCSFLELDGSTDATIKTQEDVFALINKNNLPEASYTIQTSQGHYHLIWTYVRPLPWTNKGESYWLAQQARLIQLFQKSGFNVDVGASLNPCQFLRNPSQLNPFNFKRNCKVYIHKSYKKTSLRSLYKALNSTNIQNPRPLPASVKLRRYLRQNKTFTLTHKELSINLGIALSTAERIVKRAIANGDMFAVGKVGNNKRIRRATKYRSGLYLEPQFSEPSHSINTNNSLPVEDLLRDFKQKGTSVGRRQKTIFALGLYLKHQLGKRASIEAIRDQLEGGAMRSHVREKEFERTLKNIMKDSYTNPFSLSKLREWDLLEETKHFH